MAAAARATSLDQLVRVRRAHLAVEERGVTLDLDQLEARHGVDHRARAAAPVLTSACARLIRWVRM